MMRLRVGTRGSDLAVCQTRIVYGALRKLHPSLDIQEVVIKSHGDQLSEQPFGGDWPVGAFVQALEQALLDRQVDFVVHSFKDVQTAPTPGLTIAAVPAREVVHDVLLTKMPVSLDRLPAGFCIGTGSPRRSAQFRRLGPIQVVPIRGNVPTRIKKLAGQELDGIVLAAAGLRRLGITHPFSTDLPLDRFLPAPAQGALAIQSRTDEAMVALLQPLEDANARAAAGVWHPASTPRKKLRSASTVARALASSRG